MNHKKYTVIVWNRAMNESPKQHVFETFAEANAFKEKHEKKEGFEVSKIEARMVWIDEAPKASKRSKH